MYKKNDPLVEAVRRVMYQNDIIREVEERLNEELGIYNKKHLPHEYHAAYDEMLAEAIEKAMINEMAGSKAQQKAAGAALSAKRGETPVSELRGASKEMYKSMSEKKIRDFAKTERKGLPEKVNESNELDEVLNEIAANLYSDMYSIFESGDAQAYIDFMNSLTEEQLELLGVVNEAETWLGKRLMDITGYTGKGMGDKPEPKDRPLQRLGSSNNTGHPYQNQGGLTSKRGNNDAQGKGSIANVFPPSGGGITSAAQQRKADRDRPAPAGSERFKALVTNNLPEKKPATPSSTSTTPQAGGEQGTTARAGSGQRLSRPARPSPQQRTGYRSSGPGSYREAKRAIPGGSGPGATAAERLKRMAKGGNRAAQKALAGPKRDNWPERAFQGD